MDLASEAFRSLYDVTKKTESSVALAGPPWAAVGDLASGLMV